MKSHFRRRRPRASSEEGQTFIPIAVIILLLLLGMMGVAIDYSQLWAHRQMAQGAADAACQAGAADLYINAIDPDASGKGGLQNFNWIGTAFDCSTNTGTPPCSYATANGYSGSAVSITFPKSLAPTIPDPPGPPANPYIQVTVTDQVPMTFTRLLSPNPSVAINAKAVCGLVSVKMPTPLVILHTTASGALSVTGSSKITIYGGPQRSIQVNSKDPGAVVVSSTTDTINLSNGGPKGTGSDFAVFGGPQSQPAGIDVGSAGTGHYLSPALPLDDPFATYTAPPQPKALGSVRPVPFRVNGCPDPSGCVEFTAGDYTGCSTSNKLLPGAQGCLLLPYKGTNPKFKIAAPDWVVGQKYTAGTLIQPTNNNGKNFLFIAINSGTATGGNPAWPQTPCAPQSDGTCAGQTVTDGGGIQWQNVGTVASNLQLTTGIFDPGLYWVDSNGLSFGDNSTVRVSTATGDGSNGVMFYFSSSGTVSVTSNSGKSSACTTADNQGTNIPSGCIVAYDITGAVSSAATGYLPSQKLQCPNGSANPQAVQNQNPLNGNILLGPCNGNYASPDGNHGFLFFQNRSNSVSAGWGGGGQFLSSGFLYFHSGNGTPCGTGSSCLQLQGGSGAQSFTIGNIVVDTLSMGGNPQINMILNPDAKFSVLEPTLLE